MSWVSESDLASVLCSLAGVLGANRITFLHTEESSGAHLNASLTHKNAKLLHAAKRLCLVNEMLLGDFFSSATGVYLGSYLSASVAESAEQLNILNKAMQKLRMGLFSWIIFCNEDLFNDALSILPWTLDNKVLLLVPEGQRFSAWDVYRTSPSTSSIPQLVTAVSMPPLQEQLSVLGREPWSRRTNLTGLVVKGSILQYKPYIMISETENDEMDVTGISNDIWKYLQDRLSFKLEYSKPKDGLWGNYNETNNQWSGVLGELQRSEKDLSTAPYVYSQERARFFDFSSQIQFTKQTIVHQMPSALSEGSNYMKQFSTTSWLAVAVSFLMSVCAVKIMNHYSFSWSDSVIKNIRIFCNMGYGAQGPRCLSHRAWLLGTMCTIILLHVYYTAFLIAALSTDAYKLPVKDLNDIYERRGEYTLGLTKDSVVVEDFKFARDPLLAKLWRDVVLPDPLSVADREAQIARTLSNKKHVFVTGSSARPTDCRLTVLPGTFFKRGTNMPMRRNFPALPIFNYGLRKLFEGGIIQQLHTRWRRATVKEAQCTSGGPEALGLGETHSGFYPLVGGMLASAALLLVECLVHRTHRGTPCRKVRAKTSRKLQASDRKYEASRVT